MSEPVAIDYKDQVPSHATRDNPLRRRGHAATVPAAANIPGVVAGIDLLYRRYASKKLPWSDLDRAGDRATRTPATSSTRRCRRSIAEGRRFFAKYPASRTHLPAGRQRAAGRRALRRTRTTPRRCGRSRRTARTRSIAASIARRIADDMAKNGGLITLDDLAQYRAIERRPLAGRTAITRCTRPRRRSRPARR